MLGRLNLSKKSQSGGGTSLNIFAQNTEPTNKEGIWINTSETDDLPEISKFDYEGIEQIMGDYVSNASTWKYCTHIESSFGQNGGTFLTAIVGKSIYIFFTAWSAFTTKPMKAYKYDTITNSCIEITAPQYSAKIDNLAVIGNEIYIFCVGSNNSWGNAFKYNVVTGVYTQLPDMPFSDGNSRVDVYGTDIFLFGRHSDKTFYKFDTLTNEYIQLATPTLNLGDHYDFIIGSKIFFVGGFNIFYYDITNDIFTYLPNIPYDTSWCGASSIGSNIYIFGSCVYGNKRKTYKYDTTTDTWTRLCDIPSDMPYCRTINRADGILLWNWGNNGVSDKVYLYDYIQNAYNELPSIPPTIQGGVNINNAVIDDVLYLFAPRDGSNYQRFPIYRFSSTTFIDKYIYLMFMFDAYKAKITNDLSLSIANACICQNGELKKYPAYYGDGTNWHRLPY